MRILNATSLLLVCLLTGCAHQWPAGLADCTAPHLERIAAQKRLPGLAVGIGVIGVKGELIWTNQLGYAELSQPIPLSANTSKFRIGSTSKALTAFVVARLVRSGRIDIDAPLGTILPNLPQAHRDTTLRYLAGHLGGVRHYLDLSELGSTREYASSEEALTIFIDDPLVANPGDAYAYSTYGYTLLSAALEEITQTPFPALMQEQALTPLGMTNTVPDTASVEVPERTEFYYLKEDGEYQVGPAINSSYKWAGGGYLSTVEDLVKFGLAHFDDRVLNDDSRSLLWQSQQTSSGEPTGYGVGWFVYEQWVEHPGGALGGSVLLRIYPQEQTVVAIAANLSMLGEDRFDSLPDRLFECASR